MKRLLPYKAVVSARYRMLLQYRAAAFAGLVTQCFWGAIRLMIVAAFYAAATPAQPMSLPEVAVFYGLVNCTFACADALSRGFDQFGALYIKTRHFDRLLLRPRSTIIQLAGHELALRRLGRFGQGLIVLV
jgi:viologen exporter family transport system permease protein